ncbi:MAG: hypothetical protein JWM16_3182 [Verrucomicrobiales bacterium]|nr:hypothetical protein [Verrucomicrobiales bacterium]
MNPNREEALFVLALQKLESSKWTPSRWSRGSRRNGRRWRLSIIPIIANMLDAGSIKSGRHHLHHSRLTILTGHAATMLSN